MLKSVPGFADKVAYRAFPEEEHVELPVLVYFVSGNDNFAADNVVFSSSTEITVKLYTEIKSPETERLVEALLDQHGLYWEKYETYLDDQKCYEIVYTITI